MKFPGNRSPWWTQIIELRLEDFDSLGLEQIRTAVHDVHDGVHL